MESRPGSDAEVNAGEIMADAQPQEVAAGTQVLLPAAQHPVSQESNVELTSAESVSEVVVEEQDTSQERTEKLDCELTDVSATAMQVIGERSLNGSLDHGSGISDLVAMSHSEDSATGANKEIFPSGDTPMKDEGASSNFNQGEKLLDQVQTGNEETSSSRPSGQSPKVEQPRDNAPEAEGETQQFEEFGQESQSKTENQENKDSNESSPRPLASCHNDETKDIVEKQKPDQIQTQTNRSDSGKKDGNAPNLFNRFLQRVHNKKEVASTPKLPRAKGGTPPVPPPAHNTENQRADVYMTGNQEDDDLRRAIAESLRIYEESKNKNKTDATSVLRSGGNRNQTPAKARSMRAEYRKILQTNHSLLVQDLDISILPRLIQDEVFTFDMGERIKAEKTRADQISLLLTTLERRGDDAFPKFMKALKDNFSFLYEMVRDNFDDYYDFYLPSAKIRRSIREVTYGDSDSDEEGYIAIPTFESSKASQKEVIETHETLGVKADVEVEVLEFGFRESADGTVPKSIEEGKQVMKVKLIKGEVVIKDTTSDDEENSPMVRVIDVQGFCLLVPVEFLQPFGDPREEPWFFPREISSRQATLLLKDLKFLGTFMVYKSSSRTPGVIFNLSVCSSSGEVVHYPILQNERKEVYINEEKMFTCVQDLVKYYHKNRGTLICRLRKCPRELGQTLSGKIPPQFEINPEELVFDAKHKYLGKGNFGSVVLAEYRGSQVAVKFSRLVDGEMLTADFLEEVQIMMDLDHENILRLVGMSIVNEIFLVTEYMPLGDLKRWLRSHPPLDVAHAVRMGCQVLSALAYLKQLKYVIHRDVAARNCLLPAQDKIKLSDFGMARVVDDDYYRGEEKEKIPVRWAAIETLKEQKYSTASDVWSAGVLFCELFSAGEMPYAGMSNHDVAQHIGRGGRMDKPRGCPEGVFDLIQMCWEKDPKRRPGASYLKEMFRGSIYGAIPAKETRPKKPKDDDEDEDTYVSPNW